MKTLLVIGLLLTSNGAPLSENPKIEHQIDGMELYKDNGNLDFKKLDTETVDLLAKLIL